MASLENEGKELKKVLKKAEKNHREMKPTRKKIAANETAKARLSGQVQATNAEWVEHFKAQEKNVQELKKAFRS